MVGIGNETSDGAENCKRLDLQVGRGRHDVRLVQRDVRVILFVDVQVFDEALLQEVIKSKFARLQLLQKIMASDYRNVYTA